MECEQVVRAPDGIGVEQCGKLARWVAESIHVGAEAKLVTIESWYCEEHKPSGALVRS